VQVQVAAKLALADKSIWCARVAVMRPHVIGRFRTHFVVLHGALNSMRVFLPAMPPSTVSGNVTSAQMTRMITIVPKGSAAVLCNESPKTKVQPVHLLPYYIAVQALQTPPRVDAAG